MSYSEKPSPPSTADVLVPIVTLIHGRTRRALYADCRRGRYPGAVKDGRVWLIRPRDLATWIDGQTGATAANDAEADLLRAGARFGR